MSPPRWHNLKIETLIFLIILTCNIQGHGIGFPNATKNKLGTRVTTSAITLLVEMHQHLVLVRVPCVLALGSHDQVGIHLDPVWRQSLSGTQKQEIPLRIHKNVATNSLVSTV
jgi:hypothetical protein